MPIPFKAKLEPEIVDVAGFQLPKYGSLTVYEQAFIFDLDIRREELLDGLTNGQADIALKEELATLMLQRVEPSWTIEQTKAYQWEVGTPDKPFKITPTVEMLDALFDFCMNEQRRWREPQPQEQPTEKKQRTGKKSSLNSAEPIPA